MGTLRKLKLSLKTDRDFRKTLIRGSRNEILIDLDGDDQPDIAIIDTNGNGDADTVAVDFTGNGEFDLYVKDTNHNGVIDQILYDADGDGVLEEIAGGDALEERVIVAMEAVSTAIQMGEYVTEVLDSRLDDLEKEIKQARKELKKLN